MMHHLAVHACCQATTNAHMQFAFGCDGCGLDFYWGVLGLIKVVL